jgi:hypothetical protein
MAKFLKFLPFMTSVKTNFSNSLFLTLVSAQTDVEIKKFKKFTFSQFCDITLQTNNLGGGFPTGPP